MVGTLGTPADQICIVVTGLSEVYFGILGLLGLIVVSLYYQLYSLKTELKAELALAKGSGADEKLMSLQREVTARPIVCCIEACASRRSVVGRVTARRVAADPAA